METFVMLGKYTPQALADMSAKRTKDCMALIKKNKGKVLSMHATLGNNDLVLIVDFPGVSEAMKASVALSKLTGIGFCTSPAVTVEAFDKLMAGA